MFRVYWAITTVPDQSLYMQTSGLCRAGKGYLHDCGGWCHLSVPSGTVRIIDKLCTSLLLYGRKSHQLTDGHTVMLVLWCKFSWRGNYRIYMYLSIRELKTGMAWWHTASPSGWKYHWSRDKQVGNLFHVIVGRHHYGNYICIPNHNIGCELSDYSDI